MEVNNTKVTQAVLRQVVENNTAALEKIDRRLEKIDACIVNVERRLAVVETRQDHLKEDVGKIDRKTNTWGGFNSLGAAIAGFIAWFR